jgi:hypothetical protein
LDQPTLGYILETYSQKWFAHASERNGGYELRVDDDFSIIYNSKYHAGGENFHSCMTNAGYESFYNDAVDASAASIWKNDQMYARCVIFNKVSDVDSGEVFRLAERQYAARESELYKHILVNMLIKGGYIDGYKKIGAGCHDDRAFVSNSGESWSGRRFKIDCDLEDGDTLSYQDSFGNYSLIDRTANNYRSDDYDLKTTSGRFYESEEEEREWDSYHQEYADSVVPVYVWNGRRWNEETCDEDYLDDFRWVERYDAYYQYDYCNYSEAEDEYIPYDEAIWCEYEEDYQWNDWVVYCEEADMYFTSNDARNEWLEENREEEEEEEEEEEVTEEVAPALA